ncbi:tetratricopeptide repeat protein [Neisseria sp. S1]|uniref:tetratricopeptide repeat protein n=1 Tax=Neisseria sp. S1 TaxID=3318354 RepID=UPI003A85E9BE
MFFGKTRIRPVCAILALCCSISAYAAVGEVSVVMPKETVVVQKKRFANFSEQERAQEQQRRSDIIQRTNQMFTLLGAEMALQKGDAGTALATYMVMLDRIRSSEVAERAMEMALSLNAYEQAEAIFQKWREIEPEPGAAQKRMAWGRSLIAGDIEYARNNFNDVLRDADEEQTRRIFLLLSQMSVQQPDLAKKLGSSVHRFASKYPDMPEAVIADVIFSAQNQNSSDAVRALQKLAELDADIRPPTELTLRLIAQRNPEVLNRFFTETDTRNLSPVWQELEISSMINSGNTEEAYNLLQKLLAQNPNADLYIQAALLAVQRDNGVSEVNTYLEKAYSFGTHEQKNRAAVIGAMRSADAKDYTGMQVWLDRIDAPEYIFDREVLRASMAAERGDWRQALVVSKQARRLPAQQGRFFTASDLLRVQLFAIGMHDQPRQAIIELNSLLAQAEKQQDADEQVADVLYQRALIYADKLQQPQKAIVDLRRYLAFNPNSAGGMNALGYTMLSLPSADAEEAFSLIQAAYHLEPESAAINDSMGWAYFRKGDPQAALPYLQYAFEQYPDPEVGAHLGEVLWVLGEREKAKQIWAEGFAKKGNKAVLEDTLKRLGVQKNTLPKVQSN